MELKNIFITGAATGIGKATAEIFYQQGWSLGLVDIDVESLHNYTQHWDKKRVFCARVDVTNITELEQALHTFCQRTFGRLRALHNNAGVMDLAYFDSLPLNQHHRTINVNVTGVINTLMAAFPYLRAAENATVINMASASTLYGIPQFSSYAASKSAVQSLTESLQIEWRDYGIHLLDMMPPFVDTTLVSKQSIKPPIIERMGVDIGPNDVAQTVFDSILSGRTHIPVSRKFALLYHVSQWLPYPLRKPIIGFLSRPDRRELDPVQRGICGLINLGPELHTLPVPAMRRAYLLLNRLFGLPKDDDISADCFQIPVPTGIRKTGVLTEIPARIYKPLLAGEAPKATLVFFHGGGGVMGDLNTHDAFCRQLAQGSKINVIAVSYRLAPEVQFPEPLCDAIDAWNWILRNRQELGLGNQKIGVGGDSFGGYLSAICSTPALQQALPINTHIPPDFQVLLYPIFDFRGITQSVKENGRGLLFSIKMLHRFRSLLFHSAADMHRTDANIQLHEKIAETVPTLLYSAEFDLLRDDSFTYAQKLSENHVAIKHVHLRDCAHGFIHVARFSKRVKKHLADLYNNLNQLIQ